MVRFHLSSGAVLRPPTPMLAKLESTLPVGPVWRYEPKLDGFRGLLWHSEDGLVRLLSRNARDLAPWFPELTRAATSLPRGTLVDGEIVIADEHGSADFGALQHRLTVARKHVDEVAAARPACWLPSICSNSRPLT